MRGVHENPLRVPSAKNGPVASGSQGFAKWLTSGGKQIRGCHQRQSCRSRRDYSDDFFPSFWRHRLHIYFQPRSSGFTGWWWGVLRRSKLVFRAWAMPRDDLRPSPSPRRDKAHVVQATINSPQAKSPCCLDKRIGRSSPSQRSKIQRRQRLGAELVTAAVSHIWIWVYGQVGMNGTLLTISVIHTYPALLLETGPRAIHTYPSTASKSLIPSHALIYNKVYQRSSKINKGKHQEKQKQQRPAKSKKEQQKAAKSNKEQQREIKSNKEQQRATKSNKEQHQRATTRATTKSKNKGI